MSAGMRGDLKPCIDLFHIAGSDLGKRAFTPEQLRIEVEGTLQTVFFKKGDELSVLRDAVVKTESDYFLHEATPA